MIVRGSVMPSQYREIEYIQSTGTQWINTGVKQRYTSGKVYIKAETCQVNDTTTATFNFGNAYTQCGFKANGIYQTKTLVEVTWDSSTKKETILVDGVQKVNTSWNSASWDNAPIFLCNLGNPSGPYYNSTAHFKYWSCKIYYDDILVRDMIPCERISDNAVGMYDKVNDTFYDNAGTGVFTKGPYNSTFNDIFTVHDVEPSLVPFAYQQVEYIQSTGSQRIKTNIQPTSKYKIEEEFAITDRTVISCLWCARGANTGAYSTTAFNIANNQLRCDYGTSASMINIGAVTVNQKYTLTMDAEKWYLDGVLKTTMTAATYTAGSKLQLMASHYNGIDANIGNYAKMKLYRFSVWDADGELVGNFIPCYRRSDNVAGLYDTVEGGFYTNSGSGTLGVGQDVNNPIINFVTPLAKIDYQQVEYIQSSGSQYINTDYYWQSETTQIEADIMVTSNSGNQSLWGNEEYINTSSSTRYFSGIPHGRSGSFSYYIGTTGYSGVSIGMNTRATVVATTDTSKKVLVTVNGTTKLNTTYNITCQTHTADFTSDSKGLIYIFANHNSGKTTNYSPTQTIGGMRLYRFKMWDDNVLVRDFVPCYRKSDNKIGLIDIVNNVFYTTPTDDFTKGDDVANTDVPIIIL